MKEAQKCFDELKEKQTQIELTSSPRFFFEGVRMIVAQVIQKAVNYTESIGANQQIVNNINRELNYYIVQYIDSSINKSIYL